MQTVIILTSEDYKEGSPRSVFSYVGSVTSEESIVLDEGDYYRCFMYRGERCDQDFFIYKESLAAWVEGKTVGTYTKADINTMDQYNIPKEMMDDFKKADREDAEQDRMENIDSPFETLEL